MRTTSCHGPSGVAARDLGEPPLSTPPSWGGLTRIDPLAGLAGEARRRVHENNLRVREADAERYAAYLEDYLRGALSCRTPAELRAYGKPAPPDAGLEPDGTLAERMEFERGPWDDMGDALYRTNGDLGGHILKLERKPVPLEIFFDLSLAAKVQMGGRALGASLSSRNGARVEGGARAGRVSISATGTGGGAVGLDAGVAGAKVTFSAGRAESVEVKARPAPGLAVHVKRSAGSIEHAISVGGKVGGMTPGAPALEIEARASVGVNLLTAEVVGRAISNRSYWEEE